MKKILIIFFFTISSSLYAQTVLTVTGQSFSYSDVAGLGYDVPRSTPTTFTFSNNSVTDSDPSGHMLSAGDERSSGLNNHLEGEVITGNKFTYTGPNQAQYILHGIFTGHNINVSVMYNYCLDVPMAIVRKSTVPMTNTSGGVAYNIINDPYAVGVAVKGINGVNIYNNTIYSTQPMYSGETVPGTWRGLIDVYTNTDVSPNVPATGTKIKNNIFYTTNQIYNIYIYDAACLDGFESDYNVFYCESGTPIFNYLGTVKTFAQWQALGFDTHSVVVNPNFKDFTDFVPSGRLDYGTDLGSAWQTGLSVNAVWGTTNPEPTNQNGTWQVGARVYALIEQGVYYVSTTGSDSNPGTKDLPFATWQKGFDTLSAGQTLYIRGGTYYPTATISNNMYCGVAVEGKLGTAGNRYNVLAYPGETPVLDGRNLTGTSFDRIGILLAHSDYWYLKGLEITRCDQLSTGNRYGGQGLLIYGGKNNTIENCVAHHNGGPGMGSRGDVNETNFINCDSYSNWDEFSDLPGDNADGYDIGFANNNAIIRMTGCRAWNNGDDGFDMYQYPGYSGIYYLTNCWAWHQGYWPDGISGGGNGCGFKYGDDPQTYDGVTRRFTYNCVAFNNRTRGFSQELADVRKEFYNCISYHNKQRGWSFYGLDIPDILRNNVAFGDGVDQLGTIRISDHNSWSGGITVSEADFVSVDGTQLAGPRQSDGSLPEITFLHLAPGSDLIDAGIDIGLPYLGSAPDLGAFEFTGINNHPPVISDQSFEIDKKSPAGTVVGTIVASDPDAGQTLDFSIVSGNTGDAFAIDSITGVLTVAKDSALKADFALVVKVQDNGAGNMSNQATISINVKTVGIEPVGSNANIKVYPNPASDELTIEQEGNINKLDFEILNSTGVVVFKGTLSERIVIAIANFSPGIYFLKLRNGITFEFKKIIKL